MKHSTITGNRTHRVGQTHALLLALALASLAAAGCVDAPAADGSDELATTTGAIVNGATSWSADVVSISAGQGLAVGAIMDASGWGGATNICTGTLISPTVVLTAAHCVVTSPWGSLGPNQVRFNVGADALAPSSSHAVSEVHVHPDYEYWSSDASSDVAIFVLAQPAAALEPGIETVPVNCGPLLGGDFLGRRLQTVGYGATDLQGNASNSLQYWAEQDVASLSDFDFVIDGYGEQGVCYGDSGGPALWAMPDGTTRVVGVLSWGDELCAHQDHFVRTDYECEFIEPFLGCTPSCAGATCGDDGCGGTCGGCDDGDACNGVETCEAGQCAAGAPLICDDGDVCNGVEACSAGECLFGSPLDCDDGDACTEDACGAEGCVSSVISGCCVDDADCGAGERCDDSACVAVVAPQPDTSDSGGADTSGADTAGGDATGATGGDVVFNGFRGGSSGSCASGRTGAGGALPFALALALTLLTFVRRRQRS